MGGKQRMAKADLARLVLLCTDNLYGELKQARRQIPRRGKGKVTGHIKRLVNIQHKAVWREACGNDRVRSEERRVGKGGVSTCRSRGWPDHEKKNKKRLKIRSTN